MQILDKVRIKLLKHQPTASQPENYLYDSRIKWGKTGQSSLTQIIQNRGYDKVNQIFYNNGKEVSEEELGGQPSLLFINAKNSNIFIKTFLDGNRRIQFNFVYNNITYQYFKISDELVKNNFADKPR